MSHGVMANLTQFYPLCHNPAESGDPTFVTNNSPDMAKTDDVLQLLAEGKTTKAIGKRLGIAEPVVRRMITNHERKQQHGTSEAADVDQPVSRRTKNAPMRIVTPAGTIEIDGQAHVRVSRNEIHVEW